MRSDWVRLLPSEEVLGEPDIVSDPASMLAYSLPVITSLDEVEDAAPSWYADKRRVALTAAVAKFNPKLHPRGKDGKFIDVGGLIRWFTVGGWWKTGKVDHIDPKTGDIYVLDPDGTGKPTVFKHDQAKSLYSVPKAKAKLSLPDPSAGVYSDDALKGFKKVGGQGGSNPGALYEVTDAPVPDMAVGEKAYIKKSKSKNHASNEILANRLYELAGVAVPEVYMGEDDASVASQIVHTEDGGGALSSATPEQLDALRANFAVDAWLANWDVIGLEADNVVIASDGTPVRIDAGGALLYRAQGSPKGNMFGNTVTEIDTMRDSSKNPMAAKYFGDVSDADIRKNIEKISAISEDDIRKLVADLNMDEVVADTILMRRYWLQKKFKVEAPPADDIVPVYVHPPDDHSGVPIPESNYGWATLDKTEYYIPKGTDPVDSAGFGSGVPYASVTEATGGGYFVEIRDGADHNIVKTYNETDQSEAMRHAAADLDLLLLTDEVNAPEIAPGDTTPEGWTSVGVTPDSIYKVDGNYTANIWKTPDGQWRIVVADDKNNLTPTQDEYPTQSEALSVVEDTLALAKGIGAAEPTPPSNIDYRTTPYVWSQKGHDHYYLPEGMLPSQTESIEVPYAAMKQTAPGKWNASVYNKNHVPVVSVDDISVGSLNAEKFDLEQTVDAMTVPEPVTKPEWISESGLHGLDYHMITDDGVANLYALQSDTPGGTPSGYQLTVKVKYQDEAIPVDQWDETLDGLVTAMVHGGMRLDELKPEGSAPSPAGDGWNKVASTYVEKLYPPNPGHVLKAQMWVGPQGNWVGSLLDDKGNHLWETDSNAPFKWRVDLEKEFQKQADLASVPSDSGLPEGWVRGGPFTDASSKTQVSKETDHYAAVVMFPPEVSSPHWAVWDKSDHHLVDGDFIEAANVYTKANDVLQMHEDTWSPPPRPKSPEPDVGVSEWHKGPSTQNGAPMWAIAYEEGLTGHTYLQADGSWKWELYKNGTLVDEGAVYPDNVAPHDPVLAAQDDVDIAAEAYQKPHGFTPIGPNNPAFKYSGVMGDWTQVSSTDTGISGEQYSTKGSPVYVNIWPDPTNSTWWVASYDKGTNTLHESGQKAASVEDAKQEGELLNLVADEQAIEDATKTLPLPTTDGLWVPLAGKASNGEPIIELTGVDNDARVFYNGDSWTWSVISGPDHDILNVGASKNQQDAMYAAEDSLTSDYGGFVTTNATPTPLLPITKKDQFLKNIDGDFINNAGPYMAKIHEVTGPQAQYGKWQVEVIGPDGSSVFATATGSINEAQNTALDTVNSYNAPSEPPNFSDPWSMTKPLWPYDPHMKKAPSNPGWTTAQGTKRTGNHGVLQYAGEDHFTNVYHEGVGGSVGEEWYYATYTKAGELVEAGHDPSLENVKTNAITSVNEADQLATTPGGAPTKKRISPWSPTEKSSHGLPIYERYGNENIANVMYNGKNWYWTVSTPQGALLEDGFKPTIDEAQANAESSLNTWGGVPDGGPTSGGVGWAPKTTGGWEYIPVDGSYTVQIVKDNIYDGDDNPQGWTIGWKSNTGLTGTWNSVHVNELTLPEAQDYGTQVATGETPSVLTQAPTPTPEPQFWANAGNGPGWSWTKPTGVLQYESDNAYANVYFDGGDSKYHFAVYDKGGSGAGNETLFETGTVPDTNDSTVDLAAVKERALTSIADFEEAFAAIPPGEQTMSGDELKNIIADTNTTPWTELIDLGGPVPTPSSELQTLGEAVTAKQIMASAAEPDVEFLVLVKMPNEETYYAWRGKPTDLKESPYAGGGIDMTLTHNGISKDVTWSGESSGTKVYVLQASTSPQPPNGVMLLGDLQNDESGGVQLAGEAVGNWDKDPNGYDIYVTIYDSNAVAPGMSRLGPYHKSNPNTPEKIEEANAIVLTKPVHTQPSTPEPEYVQLGKALSDGSKAHTGQAVQHISIPGGTGTITGWPNQDKYPGVVYVKPEGGGKPKTYSVNKLKSATPQYQGFLTKDGKEPTVGMTVTAGKAQWVGTIVSVNQDSHKATIELLDGKKKILSLHTVESMPTGQFADFMHGPFKEHGLLNLTATPDAVTPSVNIKPDEFPRPNLDAINDWTVVKNRELTKDGYIPYGGMYVLDSKGGKYQVLHPTGGVKPGNMSFRRVSDGKTVSRSPKGMRVDQEMMNGVPAVKNFVRTNKNGEVHSVALQAGDMLFVADHDEIYTTWRQPEPGTLTGPTGHQYTQHQVMFEVVRTNPDGTMSKIIGIQGGQELYGLKADVLANEPPFNSEKWKLAAWGNPEAENTINIDTPDKAPWTWNVTNGPDVAAAGNAEAALSPTTKAKPETVPPPGLTNDLYAKYHSTNASTGKPQITYVPAENPQGPKVAYALEGTPGNYTVYTPPGIDGGSSTVWETGLSEDEADLFVAGHPEWFGQTTPSEKIPYTETPVALLFGPNKVGLFNKLYAKGSGEEGPYLVFYQPNIGASPELVTQGLTKQEAIDFATKNATVYDTGWAPGTPINLGVGGQHYTKQTGTGMGDKPMMWFRAKGHEDEPAPLKAIFYKDSGTWTLYGKPEGETITSVIQSDMSEAMIDSYVEHHPEWFPNAEPSTPPPTVTQSTKSPIDTVTKPTQIKQGAPLKAKIGTKPKPAFTEPTPPTPTPEPEKKVGAYKPPEVQPGHIAPTKGASWNVLSLPPKPEVITTVDELKVDYPHPTGPGQLDVHPPFDAFTPGEAMAKVVDDKNHPTPGSAAAYGVLDGPLVSDQAIRFQNVVTPDGTEYVEARIKLERKPADAIGEKVLTVGEKSMGAWTIDHDKTASALVVGDQIRMRVGQVGDTGTPVFKPGESANDGGSSPNARVSAPVEALGTNIVGNETYLVTFTTSSGETGQLVAEERPGGSIRTFSFDWSVPTPTGTESHLRTQAIQEGWMDLGPGGRLAATVDYSTGVKEYKQSLTSNPNIHMISGGGGHTLYRQLDDGTNIQFVYTHPSSSALKYKAARGSTMNNEVLIRLPSGLSEEEQKKSLSDALQIVGLDESVLKPPTAEDVRKMAINKFATVADDSWTPDKNYDATGEPGDPTTEAILAKASAKLHHPVTLDDLRLYREKSNGRTWVGLTTEVADAIQEHQGNKYYYHKFYVPTDQQFDTMFRILSSPSNANLKSKEERASLGDNTDGQSGAQDVVNGAGAHVYTTGRSSSSFSDATGGWGMIVSARAFNRSMEVYYNPADYWGEWQGDTFWDHKDAKEYLIKREIPREWYAYVIVPSSQRDALITKLHAAGITEIGGRKIEEIIVTQPPGTATSKGFQDLGTTDVEDLGPVAAAAAAAVAV